MTISGIDSGMSGIAQMMQMQRPSQTERFQMADSNDDGSIDKVELSDITARMEEMSGKEIDEEALIAQFDSDSDGALNEDEMEAAMNSLRDSMPPPPMGGQPPMGGPPPAGGAEESEEEEASTLLEMLNSLTEEDDEESSLLESWLTTNATNTYASIQSSLYGNGGAAVDVES